MPNEARVPACLSIAGSDSGGGAGIQADLKAFARCRVHGMTAITAITAQNTVAVEAVLAIPPEMIAAQVEAVASDLGVDAVKIGMLADETTIEAVVDALDLVEDAPVVVDPVMIAESGASLLDPNAKAGLIERVLPRAAVVTPNVAEAQALAGLGAGATQVELGEAVLALGPRRGHRRAHRRGRRRAGRRGRVDADRGAALPARRLARLRLHAFVGARGLPGPGVRALRRGAVGEGDRCRGGRQRAAGTRRGPGPGGCVRDRG
jgi:Phosphomethylpyrimidine kinase